MFLETDFQKWIYVEKKIIFRMAERKKHFGLVLLVHRWLHVVLLVHRVTMHASDFSRTSRWALSKFNRDIFEML